MLLTEGCSSSRRKARLTLARLLSLWVRVGAPAIASAVFPRQTTRAAENTFIQPEMTHLIIQNVMEHIN